MTKAQQSILVIMVVLVLAGGGVAAWLLRPKTATNTNHTNRTNNAATNTANPTTNTNTDAPQNTNTTTGPINITVGEALTNPEQYNGREVCITGHYEQTYDISAFGLNTKPGSLELLEPAIWVYPIVPTTKLQCTKNATTGRTSCYGSVTVCSTFVSKPNGGIGHAGAFRYALDADATAQ